MCCLSEGDEDSTPTVCTKKGVGGSSQLHLRTERGLHPPVQGAESGHVSAQTLAKTHAHTLKHAYLVFMSVQTESAALQHQLNTIQEPAVLPVAAAPSQTGLF